MKMIWPPILEYKALAGKDFVLYIPNTFQSA